MRTLLNVAGIRKLVHNRNKKIGMQSLEALEGFIINTVNNWCNCASAQKKQILTKSTCPIESIREKALNQVGK